MSIKDSYLGNLPDELLCIILSSLSTEDLCSFCDAFQGCDHFFNERAVVKNLILTRCYKLKDLKPIAKRLSYELVTTLNINFVYWIPADSLRRFVKKLINLENLYAIDTNLGFAANDMIVYSAISNLRKLALTLKESSVHLSILAPIIETLYVNVITPSITAIVLLDINKIFPGLKSIWIDMALDAPINCAHYPIPPLALKVFYRVDYMVQFLDFRYAGLVTYYSSRRTLQPYVVCAEKFEVRSSVEKSPPDEVDEAYDDLREMHFDSPFCPQYLKKTWRRFEETHNTHVSNQQLEELNFMHTFPSDGSYEYYVRSVRTMLSSSKAEMLKKLTITTCLLSREISKSALDSANNETGKSAVEFKKKRVGIGKTNCTRQMENIFENNKYLEFLEVFHCECSPQKEKRIDVQRMFENFSKIGSLSKLTSLVVEVPSFIDGSFLLDVLTNCNSLKVLKVTSNSQNEKLNANFCLALQKTQHSLHDLRFQSVHVPIDRLMESLCKVRNKKLERLALMCKRIEKFTTKTFENFIELNPQLIFLYLSINEATEPLRKKVQATLKHYKKGDRQKIFHIDGRNVVFKKGFPIPDFHYREMITWNSQVSMLDVSKDFLNF